MVVAEISVTLAEAFHLQGFEITDSNGNYLGSLTASTLAASEAGRKKQILYGRGPFLQIWRDTLSHACISV